MLKIWYTTFFLEVWNYLDLYKELPARAYLFMAVRNWCINILKREKVKESYVHSAQLDNQLLGLDYYDLFEKLLIVREDMQVIYDQIEQLPEKCKVIFKMSYFEDRKNAEIAELLDISIRTVEHQLYLGLRTLRDKLASKGKNIYFLCFSFK
ncbi:MAG: sigma-70 family RNA polymerase sigma factor [Tannerellaceae bacterium]|nr:sigma-70 family RNA polymerase sigma factor [Tannerellaceae bacterium]